MKKIFPLLFIVCILVAILPVSVMAFNDTEGHWAEKSIDTWSSHGVLKGYEDGSFKPNGDITRGEMAKLARSLSAIRKQSVTLLAI